MLHRFGQEGAQQGDRDETDDHEIRDPPGVQKGFHRTVKYADLRKFNIESLKGHYPRHYRRNYGLPGDVSRVASQINEGANRTVAGSRGSIHCHYLIRSCPESHGDSINKQSPEDEGY